MVSPSLNKGKAMPTLWKATLPKFLTLFLISTLSLTLLFIVSKTNATTLLFSSTGSLKAVGIFLGWQMVALLPFALGLASFISASILFSELSSSSVLSSLLSLGYRLKALLLPLCALMVSVCIFNFCLISEVTTTARQKAKSLSSAYALINPLTSALTQFQNAPGYRAFADVESGTDASALRDLWLFRSSGKISAPSLLFASRLRPSGQSAIAEGLTLVSYSPSKGEGGFEVLSFESAEKSALSLEPLSAFFSTSEARSSVGLLPLKALFDSPFPLKAKVQEVLRRLATAFAPLVLFFLGLCLSIGAPRSGPRLLQRILVLVSATLFFVGLIVSKTLSAPLISLSVYVQSLGCIWIVLHRYKKGLL